jgi:uncharacterized protein
VSSKLLGQFVRNIEADLNSASGPTPAVSQPVTTEAFAPVPRSATQGTAPQNASVARRPEPEPLNLVSLVGRSLAKRVLPVVAVVVLAALVRRLVRRRAAA